MYKRQASNLAKGYTLETSVERAKEYISGALAAMLNLGAGSGPMNHGFDLKSDFIEKCGNVQPTCENVPLGDKEV